MNELLFGGRPSVALWVGNVPYVCELRLPMLGSAGGLGSGLIYLRVVVALQLKW